VKGFKLGDVAVVCYSSSMVIYGWIQH
jgi:hypothetical protein